MMRRFTLRAKNLYHAGAPDRAFVVGCQFGPMLLAIGARIEDALEEYAERYCETIQPDDPALADYGGETVAERLDSADQAGDVAWSGGVPHWEDPYLWVREFKGRDAVRRAGQFYRLGE